MTADTVTAPTQAQEHRRATVRPDKAETVAELVEAFRSASAAVLTEYRGLSVKQLTELRRALGGETTYAVVKNSLTSIAAKEAGLEGLDAHLTGPTAVAFVGGDPVEAAKSLREFARANPVLVVKGGVMDGKALTADEVRRLADLESREVLLGKLAGAMLASLSQAVYLLNAPLAQAARLAGALQAKAEEDPSVLRGGAGTPAPADTSTDTAGDAPVEAEGAAADGAEATSAETTDAPDADSSAAGATTTAAEAAGSTTDGATTADAAAEAVDAVSGGAEASASADSTDSTASTASTASTDSETPA
jgi:large subunit ribosomal protein L10